MQGGYSKAWKGRRQSQAKSQPHVVHENFWWGADPWCLAEVKVDVLARLVKRRSRGSGGIALDRHTIRLQVEQQRGETTLGNMVILEQLGECGIA